MLRATRFSLLLALLCSASACRTNSGHDLPPTLRRPEPHQRVELWRDDLAFLAIELSTRHVDPFRKVSEDDFRRSVGRLHERIPQLDDDGVVIEMARIAASIGDGHTGFWLHGARLGIPPGPLWLMSFEDGVFVKGVVGDLGVDILNLELIRVGGVDVEEALLRLAPLIPRDNESGIQLTGPAYLNLPRVLFAVGLSDEPGAARYVFADEAGSEVELRCSALAPDTPVVFSVRYASGSPGAPLAEHLRAKTYAYERVGDSALLQYNSCRNDPGEPFRSFCGRVFADIDSEQPSRLIIDLRWNTGGDSIIARALYQELRRRPHLTEQGRLRVLIGRTTFSSGMWAAVDLKRDFDAVLFGEPTGGTPNAPGDRGEIVLPNSLLDCGFSRRQWNRGGDVFIGPALPPDIHVPETSTQHFAGRDPVLETAAAWTRSDE